MNINIPWACKPTTTTQYLKAGSGFVLGAKYCVQTDPPDGAPARTYYDGKGRQRRSLGQTLHGEYVAADIEYDAFGRVWRESQPYFVYGTASSDAHWTVNHYDDLGRITTVEVPLGDIDGDNADDGLAITSTDYQGFTTITVDAKNRRSLKAQNALGQTVRSVDDLDDQNIAVSCPLSIYSMGDSIQDCFFKKQYGISFLFFKNPNRLPIFSRLSRDG